MVLNPILLGGVWFIIHLYSVFHTFIWRGGLSQMKLTSFEKKLSHFETIPKENEKKRAKNECGNNYHIVLHRYNTTVLSF